MASSAGYTVHESGFWFRNSDLTGPYMLTSSGMILANEDCGAGFYDNHEFRMFIELNIPAGGTFWVRHTIPVNFELHDQRISLSSGSVKWQAIAVTSSSPGPWSAKTMRRRNQMTTAPAYTSGSVIETSSDPNAAIGGIEVDLMMVSAAGTGSQSASVQQNAGLRGLAPGVYHVKMFNGSNEAAVGVYDWWWNEKP